MENQRTIMQNKAMHKYFDLLATELNDAGLTMRKVLKPEIDIDWTPEAIKNYLWKPIQDALYQKSSTTELDKRQVSLVFETLNRHLGTKLGVHVPFPTNETEMRA